MKTNNNKNEIKTKLVQFAQGVWKVINHPNLFVVRLEVGCDNGESIYQVFTRHTDPWNPANNVREFDNLQDAAKSL